MGWQYLRSSGECPICSGESRGGGRGRKDCRKQSDSPVVHCRWDGAIPAGWKLVGYDNLGFGMYAPDDGKALHKAAPRMQAAGQLSDTLPPIPVRVRDFQYRKIVKALPGLSQRAIAAMEKRGLEEREIRHMWRLGFTEWKPNFRIADNSSGYVDLDDPDTLTRDLPGVSWDGSFLVGGNGIALPALTLDGEIAGYQIAPWNANKNCKYIWLASSKGKGKDRILFNSCKLPNGEMPLAHWLHSSINLREHRPNRRLWLCEGVLKSFLVRVGLTRLGYTQDIVIGTAVGGNYAPQQIKEAIERIKPSQVIICPDAGDINNPHQAKAIHKTVAMLDGYGCNTAIAWWNQLTKKKDLDIDELLMTAPDKFKAIKFLNKWDFFNLYSKDIQLMLDPQKTYFKGLQDWGDQTIAHPFVEDKRIDFEYKEGERISTWIDQIQYGRNKIILESSEPGLGKSHEAGLLTPSSFPAYSVSKVIYVTNDPQNVTTETLKDHEVVRGRDIGRKYVDVEGPDGIDRQIRRIANDEIVDDLSRASTSNCDRAEIIPEMAARNISLDSGTVCSGCKFELNCIKGVGTYDFRYKHRTALEQDVLITHIESLNLGFIEKNPGIVLVIDEASQIKWTKEVFVSYGEIKKSLNRLKGIVLNPYQEAITRLLDLLTNDVREHYLTHEEIVDRVGKIDVLEDEILALESGKELFDLLNDKGEMKGSDRESRQASRALKAKNFLKDKIKDMPTQWLTEFYYLCNGNEDYRVRGNTSGITITKLNTRILEMLRHENVTSIIFMDATSNLDYFRKLVGEEYRAVECRQQAPAEKAEIVTYQVSRAGSKAADVVAAIEEKAIAQNKKVGKITKKEIATGNGYWFRDSRGRNTYQNADVLIAQGSPIPNLSAMIDEYALIYKESPLLDQSLRYYPIQDATGKNKVLSRTEYTDAGLARFIYSRTIAEFEQLKGRLRPNRRPGEVLELWMITSYPLPWQVIEASPAKVLLSSNKPVNTYGSASAKVEKALDYCKAEGIKPSIAALSQIARVSAGSVSASSAWKEYKNSKQLLDAKLHPKVDSKELLEAS
jgi:hypothetical protein